MRGIANKDLTPELAFNLGKAGAFVLSKNHQNPRVVIGRDTRISGDMLEAAIAAGIMAMGGEVLHVGVVPTPAVACLVKALDAGAGVMISASHNTFEYNGIKFFNREGFKLDDEMEDAIEDILVRDIDVNSHITGDRLGRCRQEETHARQLYLDALRACFSRRLDGVRLVLDCANGSAVSVAPDLFRELGADVTLLGSAPDGTNINLGCGSTHPEALQAKVLETGAFLGLAYDGDADRLIAVDERGRLLDGDRLLAICAGHLRGKGLLRDNRITATVMSNQGFLNAMEAQGILVDRTPVGDRYVLESMQKTGSVLGGEQSGHMIFLDYATTGDGILSSLQVLDAVLDSGLPASVLGDAIPIYPQVLRNAPVRDELKHKYMKDPDIAAMIRRIEGEMDGAGRVLIRPSGTEPLVRVMLEGEDLARITALAEELSALIAARLA